jgi:hypothetical protein
MQMNNPEISVGSMWVGATGYDLDGKKKFQTFVVRYRTAKTVTFSAIYLGENYTDICSTECRKITSLLTASGRIYMGGVCVTKLA